MNEKTVNAIAAPQAPLQKKQPYHTPSLQVFGRVSALTQGTGSMNGDAGQNMRTP